MILPQPGRGSKTDSMRLLPASFLVPARVRHWIMARLQVAKLCSKHILWVRRSMTEGDDEGRALVHGEGKGSELVYARHLNNMVCQFLRPVSERKGGISHRFQYLGKLDVPQCQ